MLGTLGGALEARQVDVSDGRLMADATGKVELKNGFPVIRRIHVGMRLVAPEEAREKVECMHGVHALHCPLYRTSHSAIRITSSVDWVAAW